MLLSDSKSIYIFGAHSRAQTFGVYVSALFSEKTILGYIVDDEEKNPSRIGNIRVYKLGVDDVLLDPSVPVYLATRGVFHSSIERNLRSAGFTQIIPVDPILDMSLRNEYVKREFSREGRKFSRIEDLPLNRESDVGGLKDGEKSFCIYVARTDFDSELKEKWKSSEFQTVVHAGAALSDSRLHVFDREDNEGENISSCNRQFCELTVLYWMWKNSKDEYVGLEHYRRHFLIGSEDITRIMDNDIDVVLPVPLYVSPSIKENYLARHEKTPWNAMMNSLKSRNPECYADADEYFKTSGFYSPCNMLIARREVLNELCEWLFPILFAVAEQCGSLEDVYQNRYPGFLSERLITFFFYMHRERFNIVYADKNFLN